MRSAARGRCRRLSVYLARLAGTASVAVLLIALAPSPASAHGDLRLVDEVFTLSPGSSATFEGELHYHRMVGEVTADGPIRLRLLDVRTNQETLTVGPGTDLVFNELVRCCDGPWTPHALVIENLAAVPVSVTARVSLVHDDLAVMVDGAESGTRAALVLIGLTWWALVWRAFARSSATIGLRRPAIGLAGLSVLTLGIGTLAAVRYDVGGAPSVVAGHAMLPLLPMNPVVSQATLFMGVSMLGWAGVGWWWVRARRDVHQVAWAALGVALAGGAAVVAIAILSAYGGPTIQSAWLVASVAPIIAVLAAQLMSPSPLASAA